MKHTPDAAEAATLTLTIPAKDCEVRNALVAARQRLSVWGGDQDTLAAVEIVLAEVLNNIVEHAYAKIPPGEILLWIERRADALAVAVIDDGRPMPGEMMPDTRAPDLAVDVAELPEGGFGWGLIRALSSGLSYRRISERNRLAFRIPLSVQAKDT